MTIRSANAATAGSCVTRTTAAPRSRAAATSSSATAGRGHRVEAAGRFVGQDHGRPVDQRAGDRDALLLAARELVGQLRGVRPRVRPGPAPRRATRRSVPASPPSRSSGTSTFSVAVACGSSAMPLGDESARASAEARPLAPRASTPVRRPRSGTCPVRGVEPAEQEQQRALARAARAHDGDDLARRTRQRDAVKRRYARSDPDGRSGTVRRPRPRRAHAMKHPPSRIDSRRSARSRDLGVVGHRQDGRARLRTAASSRSRIPAAVGLVELAGRLVGEQHPRAVREATASAARCAFAARQLATPAVGPTGPARRAGAARRPAGGCSSASRPSSRSGRATLLGDVEQGMEVVALQHDADTLAAPARAVGGPQPRDVLAVDDSPSPADGSSSPQGRGGACSCRCRTAPSPSSRSPARASGRRPRRATVCISPSR